MQYDYSKIVTFLYGKEEKKLNDVLKEVLIDGFTMLDVSVPNKIILLEKNNMKYVMLKNKDRILIIPDTYRGLCLTDEFGEVFEISILEDGNINVSKIICLDKPRGVGSVTSTWHFDGELYNEVVSRVMFIEYEKLNAVYNQESLEMFINNYYDLRNDILRSIFWDLTLFTKNNFINVKFSERIMISDGYTKDKFDILYKKHIDKAFETNNEKGKPSLF